MNEVEVSASVTFLPKCSWAFGTRIGKVIRMDEIKMSLETIRESE